MEIQRGQNKHSHTDHTFNLARAERVKLIMTQMFSVHVYSIVVYASCRGCVQTSPSLDPGERGVFGASLDPIII